MCCQQATKTCSYRCLRSEACGWRWLERGMKHCFTSRRGVASWNRYGSLLIRAISPLAVLLLLLVLESSCRSRRPAVLLQTEMTNANKAQHFSAFYQYEAWKSIRKATHERLSRCVGRALSQRAQNTFHNDIGRTPLHHPPSNASTFVMVRREQFRRWILWLGHSL